MKRPIVIMALVLIASPAFGGLIVIKPVSVSGSPSDGNSDGAIEYLINDNAAYDADSNAGTAVDHMQRPAGTVGNVLETGVSKADGEATLQTLAASGEKESYIPALQSSGPKPVAVFDLGADYSVDEVLFWAYANFNGGAGDDNRLGNFKLHLQTEAEGNDFSGVNWSTPDAGAFTTNRNNLGDWPNTSQAEVFTFSAQTARYVAMEFSSKANGGTSGNMAAGEVRFVGDTLGGPGGEIPEPAGVGLVGLALLAVRKRRS